MSGAAGASCVHDGSPGQDIAEEPSNRATHSTVVCVCCLCRASLADPLLLPASLAPYVPITPFPLDSCSVHTCRFTSNLDPHTLAVQSSQRSHTARQDTVVHQLERADPILADFFLPSCLSSRLYDSAKVYLYTTPTERLAHKAKSEGLTDMATKAAIKRVSVAEARPE
ncbi:hypothetical protein BCV70DRAFT_82600 [Testicularia cyperi]|uniref:Uncharacterized protein n=1 Tax=Testicularia cyperi TaxID=1882483 RepID=A0A317XF75_9BASI|nr:hypothetical protein BCV70DRAFT_82600 [Testicularia cyperi]